MRYRADLTAGALKVSESRIIANLLLRGLDEMGWKEALYGQNVLQTRSPKTTARLTLLLRGRLALMEPVLWTLVRDGSGTVATQACLAAAVKHSALLGDFLDLVVREHVARFAQTLSDTVWDDYVLDCRGRDPEMPQWSAATRDRLRSSVFQILTQAGYVENTRSLRLQPVYIASPVLDYLTTHQEHYVLRCIQVAS
jgi:Putative inner membrane protein (DUF1819)